MPWNPFSSTPRVETAAFGKHPLFSDFIEWKGHARGSLLREFRTLCRECIFPEFIKPGAEIQPPVDLLLASWSPRQFHLARALPSRDAAGRDLIPFICAARGPATPIRFWLESLYPQLDRESRLIINQRDQQELRVHWEKLSTQLEAAWENLCEQERHQPAPQSVVAHACPAHYVQSEAFASGLYRIQSWLPSVDRAGAGAVLLPPVSESIERSLFFWMVFLSQALRSRLPISGIANLTHNRLSIATGFFPKSLFIRLREPTEHGAFFHELPSFRPSSSFLGLLQQVRRELAERRLPEFELLSGTPLHRT